MSLDIACLDTICALSSATGLGAIAIVRASGSRCKLILSQIFINNSGVIKNFMAMRGDIVTGNGQIVDDVVAIFFPHKKSFTGEESFEIHCHGNSLIVTQILDLICAAGARLAEPGEFSMRAMLNGKIDLAQAESIADLIHAKSLAAKDAALCGLKGALANKTQDLRQIIVEVLAEIEARMDFPDEDLGNYDKSHLLEKIDSAAHTLQKMLENSNYALKLHEGARILIIGLPNAGKSTLLNNIVQEERAIVHDEAGTTRDVIEVSMDLFGLPVVIVDVAGIRSDCDIGHVERMGIERAFVELEKAHVIIWLADAQCSEMFINPLIEKKLALSTANVIKVLNKCDLACSNYYEDALKISAKSGLGLEKLKLKLHEAIAGKPGAIQEIFITRARQKDELELALDGLNQAKLAIENNLVDEVISSELRSAGYAFDRLHGREIAEDILDKIFSQFCIGK